MDFDFREDEQAVVDLARQILRDFATNERLRTFGAGGLPYDTELWQALAKATLLGTAVPEGFGGAGLGFLALGLFAREVGRTVAPVPVVPTLVLGALPLARFGRPMHQDRWLADVVAGSRLLTAALAECASSDPLAPATRAAPHVEGVILNGTKTMVPYAALASHILVPARFDDGRIGLFWVEPHGSGVVLTPQVTPDGQPHAQIELRDAVVSSDARLTSSPDDADALRWLVQHAIAARCMVQLGVIERALEMTADYSRTRTQFDRPLGSLQAFHQRAADAYINVEAVRLTALDATWRLSRDLPTDDHVAVAKFWAAEGGQSAAYACQHLHGGIGIDVDYPLHRYFTWATQIEHELGSAKHHLDRLGRAIATHGLPPG